MFDFNDFSTQAELIQAVRAIRYDGTGTRTGNALNFTRENKLSPEKGRRPDVPLMIVVLTDGKTIQSCSPNSSRPELPITVVPPIVVSTFAIGLIFVFHLGCT